MLREAVLTGLNLFIGCFDLRSFKWRLSDELRINNDSDWPDINFIWMAFIFKNLRSNVVWSTADGLLLLPFIFEAGGQTEIAQFDFHIFIQEQVTEFEIPVDDFVLVQIFQGRNYLSKIVLSLHFCKSFPPFDELVEGVVCTDFQKNIHIFVIFEYMLKFDNVGIV